MHEFIYDIPGGVIAAVLLVAMWLAIEVGWRIGQRRKGAAAEEARAQINATVASILGILALLLAFTFSLSLQRFDSRNDAVVDEANAIGTAYLRAQLLPASLRNEVRRSLVEYVDVRVQASTISIVQEGEWARLSAKTASAQTALWAQARRAAELEPNPVTTGLFIQALNEMIDSYGRRDAAISRHVPEVVMFVLFGTLIIAGLSVGFAAGVGGQRPSPVSYAMAALIVVLIFVTLDLDRPRRGLIEVNPKSLLDLQAAIKAGL